MNQLIDPSLARQFERSLGREKFLDVQLHPSAGDPGDLGTEVAALTVSQQSAEARVRHMREEQQRINALATDEAKQQLDTVVVTGTARREGLRKLDASFSITTADEEQIKQAAPSSTADARFTATADPSDQP